VQALVPWLLGGGFAAVLTILARVFLRLHTDAVDAERRRAEDAIAAERQRADDWREAHKAEVARGDVRDQQLGAILSALKREPV
jgi:hypothetical protein